MKYGEFLEDQRDPPKSKVPKSTSLGETVHRLMEAGKEGGEEWVKLEEFWGREGLRRAWRLWRDKTKSREDR